MPRITILATLPFLALPAAALAQPATTPPATNQATPAPAPAGPPPEAIADVQQAGAAFGQCLQTGVMGVSASVTPEAGATSVLAGCATQRQALEQAANALIATLPAEQRTMAQEQMRTQLGAVQGQLVAGIQQMRGAAAPAATPAPPPAPGH